jgi:hypothetical protein
MSTSIAHGPAATPPPGIHPGTSDAPFVTSATAAEEGEKNTKMVRPEDAVQNTEYAPVDNTPRCTPHAGGQ